MTQSSEEMVLAAQQAGISNVRDARSYGPVHPQYNILSLTYRMYSEVFNRLFPDPNTPDVVAAPPTHVIEYLERNNISMSDLGAQGQLIADVLDVGLKGTVARVDGEDYMLTVMKSVDWFNRIDWPVMIALDSCITQLHWSTWFRAATTLFRKEDIEAQNPGHLTEIIKDYLKEDYDKALAVQKYEKPINTGD